MRKRYDSCEKPNESTTDRPCKDDLQGPVVTLTKPYYRRTDCQCSNTNTSGILADGNTDCRWWIKRHLTSSHD